MGRSTKHGKKNILCKTDCSGLYHCLQMADYQSRQMLAFNFASRTFAISRLAQGSSKLLSAISSFMREYLDKPIKADHCAQYVDDIRIEAKDTIMRHHQDFFECVRNTGLKLTISKCRLGVKQVNFLGRTITPSGVAFQVDKVKNSLSRL